MVRTELKRVLQHTARGGSQGLVSADSVQAGGLVFLGGRYSAGGRIGEYPAGEFDVFAVPVKRQLAEIYGGILDSLGEAGLSIGNLVRVDSFLKGRHHLVGYREGRPTYYGTHRVSSVAVEVDGLADDGAGICLDAIAAQSSDIVRIEPDAIQLRSPNAFAKGLKAGNLVFAAGATASAPLDSGNPSGLADDAMIDTKYWGQSAVKTQTRHIVGEKLLPVLQAAGTGLADVVRAHVYLTDFAADAAEFLEQWVECCDGAPPPTTIMPVTTLGLHAARVEISVIALESGAKTIRPVVAEGHRSIPGIPAAAIAGGLIWCSSVVPPSWARHDDPAADGYFEMLAGLDRLTSVLAESSAGLDDLVKLSIVIRDPARLPGYAQALADRIDPDHVPALNQLVVASPSYSASSGLILDAVAAAHD
jgi:enamine deaminase RidA (YjgF/YER057c/UK114 family)